MRGGNRIYRKPYTNKQIESYVNDYKNQSSVFWSPINNRLYNNYKGWMYSIVYELDKPSANYFFFLLQPPHYSKFSGIQLTEEEFSYSETYKGWTGFKKYTIKEQKERVWIKLADRSIFSTKEFRKQNSKRLKDFYQTDKGVKARNIKSKKMLSFYKTEKGRRIKDESNLKQSRIMKEKIKDGSFTPTITNTWTHWDAKIVDNDGKTIQFRSSWEACFYYSNTHLKYENIRIKSKNGNIYINDFYDENGNILYEIKPRDRYNIEIDKITALQDYCFKKNIKFVWINENNILDYIDIKRICSDVQNVEQFFKMLKNKTIKQIYDSKHSQN